MSETISPNATIAQYTIVSKIGEGGMGEVWRARDAKLGRDVAIKVLPAALSADKDRLARFEQEAQAAGALNHPNILVIFHIGTHDGAPYIVSELLEGESLRERLKRGKLPPRLWRLVSAGWHSRPMSPTTGPAERWWPRRSKNSAGSTFW